MLRARRLSRLARGGDAFRRAAVPALFTALLAVGGCHTMRFEVANAPSGSVVEERKSYFLWGLAPTNRVDMREKCPHGVASITEETTFVDGLCEFVTLGIWSPRSSYYTCRLPPAGS